MLRIDNSLLEEVGLNSLPDSEKNSLLKHIYETLEMRVGIRLASQMSNEQLDEFERYFEAKDDQGAFKWLETNFPNYKDIVQEEFEKLKSEIAQSAPQILSASTPVNSGQQQPVQPMQQPQDDSRQFQQQPQQPQVAPSPSMPAPQQSAQYAQPQAPQQQYSQPEPEDYDANPYSTVDQPNQQYSPEQSPGVVANPAPNHEQQPSQNSGQNNGYQANNSQPQYPTEQPPAGPSQ
jgi:hypothetical protein